MKIQVDIDPESIDSIVQNELKWHHSTIKKDLLRLQNIKNPHKGQIEDREQFKKLLPALTIVCEYFGVNKK